MRPSLSSLCEINPAELRLLSHEQASKKIIDALKKSKEELALDLMAICAGSNSSYEDLSALNYKVMYIDKAISSRQQDYEEMFA